MVRLRKKNILRLIKKTMTNNFRLMKEEKYCSSD